MEARTETPERWLTSGLRRARRVTSATISFMYRGTLTGRSPSSSKRERSCSMMAISVSTFLG